MKSIKFSNTAGLVAIGAAGGAVAGLAGLAAYGLLAGKGASAAWALKTAGSRALTLLIPGSAGAVVGGVSGFVVAPKVLKKQGQGVDKQADREKDDLREQVSSLETVLASQQDAIHSASGTNNAEAMRLERIKGVGPKFAQLLHDAEIHTLEDLAQANPEALHDVLGSSAGKQLANPDSWISQAKALLSQSSLVKSV